MKDKAVPVKVGSTIEVRGKKVKVEKSCGGKRGSWYCVTHRHGFENQFYKDTHIADGDSHVLAWLCAECGNVEKP